LVDSLLLGLYDDEGSLHHVSFTSGLKAAEKRDLTEKLEKMMAKRIDRMGPGTSEVRR
jgi:ATP-dependent DNA ligase